MAPAAWFDFLAERPHRLEGVFRHNRDDVLSLVTLGAHLGGVLRDDEIESTAGDLGALRAANLVRVLHERGEPRSALRVCENALDRFELDERRARELRILRSDLLRVNGDGAAAIRALRVLASEPEDDQTAALLIALAELELTELGDIAAARAISERAALAAARRHTGRELARSERALKRLRTKLDRRARARPRSPHHGA